MFMYLNESRSISIKKGTQLQSEGDKRIQSYYVVKGLLRSYIIDEKGKEHIFMFAPEGWIIGDLNALSNNDYTKLYIDALEDSEIIPLPNEIDLPSEDLKKGVLKLARRAGVLQNRILVQMSSSSEERYHFFVETYPHLFNRIPLKMIASYLGIAPQSLSRIRNQLTKA